MKTRKRKLKQRLKRIRHECDGGALEDDANGWMVGAAGGSDDTHH
jgi:hypothetical protein